MTPSVHSPAYVLNKLLISMSLAVAPTGSDWSIYTGFLPDDPDTAIATYDTAGQKDGRIMASGETIIHPGAQIRVRSSNYSAAYARAKAIADGVDVVLMASVVMVNPAETWIIHSISRQGDILNMGMEGEGDRRRHNLTINVTMTLRRDS